MPNNPLCVVTIRADRFTMSLNLPLALEEMSQAKLRKVFQLLFLHEYERCNRETITLFDTYIPALVLTREALWREASAEYAREFRVVDRYTPRDQRNLLKAQNKILTSDLSRAKRRYEKAVKVNAIYAEMKEKYEF